MITYSKIFIAVNPASGLGNSIKLFESIKNQLNNKKFEIKTFITTKKEDLVKIINENDWEDTLLMVFGGDGSFNQVINEIIKNNVSVHLLPLPCGTSNVYNKAVSVDKETIAEKINFCRLQSKQFRVGEVEYDKGRVAYFFSMCGAGFDAYIVEKLNNIRKRKLYIWSYLTVSIRELFLKNYKPVNFRIFVDTKIFQNVFFALFFNINAYGGPFAFFKEVGASHNDLLYMIKFEKMGVGSVPYIYAKALKNYLSLLFSNYKSGENPFPYIECMEAMLDKNSSDKVLVHVDGDPLTTLPVIVRKSPKSITVCS